MDFHEALADLQRRFSVDEDRIVIRGFSLGGHSAWHLGAHFASRWAAVAPGAGFSESPEFLKVFAKEQLEAQLVGGEAVAAVRRARPTPRTSATCPLVAYSGEKDKQKQAADLMAGVLGKAGIELVHVIGPDTNHSYHPDAKARINQLVDTLAAQGRDPLPRRVTLVTPTLKYPRQAWLQIDGLEAHWSPGRIDGELQGDDRIALRTKGVTALSLHLPSGRAPFSRAARRRSSSTGSGWPGRHRHRTGRGRRRFTARAAAGRPAPCPRTACASARTCRVPIDDAFMGSFVFVIPSDKPLSPQVGGWVTAEQARAIREWRRQFRGEPRVRQDRLLTDAEIAEHNLVLWGDPQSNRIFARTGRQAAHPVDQGRRAGRQADVRGRQPRPDRHLPQPAQPREVRRAEQRLHLPRVRLPEQRPADAQAARLGGDRHRVPRPTPAARARWWPPTSSASAGSCSRRSAAGRAAGTTVAGVAP